MTSIVLIEVCHPVSRDSSIPESRVSTCPVAMSGLTREEKLLVYLSQFEAASLG